MATEKADVVVIGSGYGGSIPAARLAEAGFRVVVLERGPRWSAADFRQSDDPRYLQTVIELVVSSSNVTFRTGSMVGGASIPMDGAHFRVPAKAFEVTDANQRRYWPAQFSRTMMDPYYAKAEQMLGVRQFAWNEIPKAGGLLAKMFDKAGASCDRARLNYKDCLGCGFCSQGCIFEKKNDLLHNYIPLAESRGAEFRAASLVDHLEPSGTGFVVYYKKGGQPAQIFGQRVFVAGGGIHTPAVLLRSKSYLPALSLQVGENFNNNGEHTFVGILPEGFDDLAGYFAFKGNDNGSTMCFHWLESDGISFHPGAGFEPTIFAASFRSDNDELIPKNAWGMEYKRFIEKIYPHRIIGFSALGLADGHRAVTLKAGGEPDFAERDRTSYDAYLDRVEQIVESVGGKTGVKLMPTTSRKLAGTTSTHLLCSCRMAESAADGVVDPNGQVFGYENLYVCDAGALPYSLAVNPALTISALSELVAEKVIAKG